MKEYVEDAKHPPLKQPGNSGYFHVLCAVCISLDVRRAEGILWFERVTWL